MDEESRRGEIVNKYTRTRQVSAWALVRKSEAFPTSSLCTLSDKFGHEY